LNGRSRCCQLDNRRRRQRFGFRQREIRQALNISASIAAIATGHAQRGIVLRLRAGKSSLAIARNATELSRNSSANSWQAVQLRHSVVWQPKPTHIPDNSFATPHILRQFDFSHGNLTPHGRFLHARNVGDFAEVERPSTSRSITAALSRSPRVCRPSIRRRLRSARYECGADLVRCRPARPAARGPP
jgi:hypothetical protein